MQLKAFFRGAENQATRGFASRRRSSDFYIHT